MSKFNSRKTRQMGDCMSQNNKMKSTKNHKKEDGTFHSKKIKHDPQAESARAVFGLKDNVDPFSTDRKINDQMK